MMASGTGKILLMYSAVTFETADVFGTYAYRAAFGDGKMSYASAIDLFTSVVNLLLVLVANRLSKKVSETSLF
jgi:putative aldouronate transport system permease protein